MNFFGIITLVTFFGAFKIGGATDCIDNSDCEYGEFCAAPQAYDYGARRSCEGITSDYLD